MSMVACSVKNIAQLVSVLSAIPRSYIYMDSECVTSYEHVPDKFLLCILIMINQFCIIKMKRNETDITSKHKTSN
jgi:hypothetical protein